MQHNTQAGWVSLYWQLSAADNSDSDRDFPAAGFYNQDKSCIEIADVYNSGKACVMNGGEAVCDNLELADCRVGGNLDGAEVTSGASCRDGAGTCFPSLVGVMTCLPSALVDCDGKSV